MLVVADPVTFWNTVAEKALAPTQGTNPVDQSRTYAILPASIHDALNAIDSRFASYTLGLAKYEFRHWRPVTAIRNAGSDGNDRTEPDAAWQPFQVTPPVPDYPSTHPLVGAAAAEILTDSFLDHQPHTAGCSRIFDSFSDAAEENGDSRIFAGIRFPYAVREGQHDGRRIGRDVGKLLPPVAQSAR